MHSLPKFPVLEGESRHKSSSKQQQSAMFVLDILEKLSLSPRSTDQSPLSVNHQIFTSFRQQRSFISSCYHLNLRQAFKVKNLVPMTMHHCRCHWPRASLSSLNAHAHVKDRCWLFVTLSHIVEFLWFSSVVVDKFTASFEVLSGLKKWFGSWYTRCVNCVFQRDVDHHI